MEKEEKEKNAGNRLHPILKFWQDSSHGFRLERLPDWLLLSKTY